jgi:hypothetical protein
MAERNKVARARQQLDDALKALSDGAGDSPISQAAGESPLVIVGETMATSRADMQPDLLRTFTRLVVGTVLLAIDELSRRASAWERQAAQVDATEVGALLHAQDVPAPTETHGPAAAGEAIVAPPADTVAPADGQLGLAMIGWVFATQERLRLDRDPGHILQAAGAQIVTTTAALIGESLGWVSGDRKARSTAAHDPRMRAWIARGRSEARHSRALAHAAIKAIVQDVIDALADEPAIQNLVQSQGTTLAGEVLGEVRERTVSADIYVDSLSRRLFRGARRSPPIDASEAPTGGSGAPADASGTQP